jgi:hypothetical protein
VSGPGGLSLQKADIHRLGQQADLANEVIEEGEAVLDS